MAEANAYSVLTTQGRLVAAHNETPAHAGKKLDISLQMLSHGIVFFAT